MKRIALSFAVVAALVFSAAACHKVDPQDDPDNGQEQTEPEPQKPPLDECILSIMSFNVAVDNRQAETGWSDRKKAVIKMLSETKPMVIGFQEAQAHEITDMVNAHPEYAWYGLGRETAKRPPVTSF